MENREEEQSVIRHFKVSVGTRVYEVAVEEMGEVVQKETPLTSPPFPKQTQAQTPGPGAGDGVAQEGGDMVVCPMPARVVSIKCSKGDRVKSGDILLVIEAMKMEHNLCAPKDGIVLDIKTMEGASVAYSQPLVLIG